MSRLLAICSLSLVVPAMADARSQSADVPMRGAAVSQRFLPGGASVVTTRQSRVCLTSRRIDIAASDYRDPDGESVDFANVIRSPATVIQAIAGADGALAFRIQLKFSPDPGAALWLGLPGGARDIAGLLEQSGDSLLIAGDLARDLAAAFDAGARPTLRSLSRATGRTVTDRLDAPDLAALDDCTALLAETDPEPADGTPAESPAMLVRAVFEAEQSPDTIASPGVMQACGMPDKPETLYLGRLQNVTGFVSHTDKVFVSYADDGAIERVYIPGIYEADLRAPGQGMLRVSRAADGNVPAAPNTVSGCIGAETMPVYYTDLGGGTYALTASADDGIPDLFSSRDYDPPITSVTYSPVPGPLPPRARRGPPIGGGGGGVPGTTITSRPPPPGTPGTPNPPDVTETLVLSLASSTRMSGEGDPPTTPPVVPPSPVPLPAGIWLLLSALGGLAGLRRMRG